MIVNFWYALFLLIGIGQLTLSRSIGVLHSAAGIASREGAVKSFESSKNRREWTADRSLGLQVLFRNLCRRQVIGKSIPKPYQVYAWNQVGKKI